MSNHALRWISQWWSWQRAAHITVAIVGGYILADWIVAWLSLLMSLILGIDKGEAVTLSSMLGFVIYLAILIWAFAEPNLGRMAGIMITAILLSYGFARVLMLAGV